MEQERRFPPDTGVPPGGVLRPWLWTMALQGREQALGLSYRPQGVRRGTHAVVSDADDRAGLCPTKPAAIAAQDLLVTWLGTRGVRWSAAQTPMRPRTDGGDVFGLNMRHDPPPHSSRSGSKRLIKPSPASRPPSRRPCQARWRQHVGAPPGALLNALNPRSRGWNQYCCSGVASTVCTDLDTCRSERAQRDRQRRHPVGSKNPNVSFYQRLWTCQCLPFALISLQRGFPEKNAKFWVLLQEWLLICYNESDRLDPRSPEIPMRKPPLFKWRHFEGDIIVLCVY